LRCCIQKNRAEASSLPYDSSWTQALFATIARATKEASAVSIRLKWDEACLSLNISSETSVRDCSHSMVDIVKPHFLALGCQLQTRKIVVSNQLARPANAPFHSSASSSGQALQVKVPIVTSQPSHTHKGLIHLKNCQFVNSILSESFPSLWGLLH
jgi:hypothetical protein